MPSVTIGQRTIEYAVRESARAGRKRIEVSPGGVQVIVPCGTDPGAVATFVDSRRRWLHDKTEEIADAVERLRSRTPEGLHSGAKVLFRGRYLRLRVSTGDVSEPRLVYRTAFDVTLPEGLARGEGEAEVARVLGEWMDARLEEDAREIVRRRGLPHGLEPVGIRIKDQETLWGSCGRDGVLRLDRKLARVPKPVFEYVVVHELCHLERRDHSAQFWGLVGRVMPGFEGAKEWLERYGVEVG
jgi:predicted metal-dependent hydrolase